MEVIKMKIKNIFIILAFLCSLAPTLFGCAQSKDGQYEIIICGNNQAEIIHVESGMRVKLLEGHNMMINSVNMSPDNKFAITGAFDKTAKIWDVETGALKHTLTGHTHYFISVSFSPDSTFAVTASADGTTRIWNVESGQCLHTLGGHPKGVNKASFSPDQTRVITAGEGIVKIWDMTTEEPSCIGQSEDSVGMFSSISFSEDSKYAIASTLFGDIKVFAIMRGLCIATIENQGIGLFASLSPDGKKIRASTTEGKRKTIDITEIIQRYEEGFQVEPGAAETPPEEWFQGHGPAHEQKSFAPGEELSAAAAAADTTPEESSGLTRTPSEEKLMRGLEALAEQIRLYQESLPTDGTIHPMLADFLALASRGEEESCLDSLD